jgi:formyl-CoA transferase
MNNIKEVFEDPHIIDRKVAVDIEHPVMGKMKAVRNPVLFEEGSPTIRLHAPSLGEHSAEILAELGYTHDQIQSYAQQGVVLLHQVE